MAVQSSSQPPVFLGVYKDDYIDIASSGDEDPDESSNDRFAEGDDLSFNSAAAAYLLDDSAPLNMFTSSGSTSVRWHIQARFILDHRLQQPKPVLSASRGSSQRSDATTSSNKSSSMRPNGSDPAQAARSVSNVSEISTRSASGVMAQKPQLRAAFAELNAAILYLSIHPFPAVLAWPCLLLHPP